MMMMITAAAAAAALKTINNNKLAIYIAKPVKKKGDLNELVSGMTRIRSDGE